MMMPDSDHISILQHMESQQSGILAKRLREASKQVRVGISIISVEEQMRGWMASIAKERNVIRQVLSYNKLAELFGFFAKFPLVAFDEECAERFDELRANKIRIGTMDLKIAATALVNDATLLSANLRDFQKVPGLRVENWLL